MLSSPDLKNFKFIDLFCGIGGMRLAYESAGCECVFSSDWDKYAQITYQKNFGDLPKGDIHAISASDIPSYDILVGGFPCQPFSISGVSKKNSLNRPHGFRDKTQGTLFFESSEYSQRRAHRPSCSKMLNIFSGTIRERRSRLSTSPCAELNLHCKEWCRPLAL